MAGIPSRPERSLVVDVATSRFTPILAGVVAAILFAEGQPGYGFLALAAAVSSILGRMVRPGERERDGDDGLRL
ncbi:MAG: hypothetical protein AAB955_02445 [Patescibacteria group bacterium]